MPRQTSVQLTEATERQAAELKAAGYGTLTEVIRVAIDRMHQQEKRKMYAVEQTDVDTLETKLIAQFSTEEQAIKAAQANAAEVNQDEITVAVLNPQGDVIWNNDGDWRNAVR
jgi:Arc/MetJ-type ribon-helix-helix transcriptional regulator